MRRLRTIACTACLLTVLLACTARAAEPVNPAGMDPALKPLVRNSPAREVPGLLARMLEGPLKDVPAVVVALKNNIGGAGFEGDFGWTLHGQRGYQPGVDPTSLSEAEKQGRLLPTPKFAMGPSKLLRVDLRTREVATLFEDPDGGVLRDPCVSYDGKRILFSMRKAKEIRYHLYEVNADGTGLRQITHGPDNEVEPCYLPDGGIVYVSSKAHRYTPCNAHEVGNLWRCEADGSKQRRLTNGMDAERFPWVLSDGRIIFARWDYVHRDQGSFFGLWTINPDGTGLMTFYGNQDFFDFGHPGYPKPIPGSPRVVCTMAYVHGLQGMVATIDPTRGPDDVGSFHLTTLGNPPATLEMLNTTVPKAEFCEGKPLHYAKGLGPDGRPLGHMKGWVDPYPISPDCFLVTNNNGERGARELCVMDGQGNYEVIATVPRQPNRRGEIEIEGWKVRLDSSSVLAGVRPLVARERELVIPHRTDWSKRTGTMVLSNIYQGRQFDEVKPGRIGSLMVMENLAQPLRFGGDNAVSLGESYNPSRYLGSVPVEEDGSAYFEVPAVRSISLIAVDDQDREVKYMRTQLTLMPGELVSCVGCHEHRTEGPDMSSSGAYLQAVRRAPSRPKRPAALPRMPVSYTKDVQPILDKHCVRCHNVADPKGRMVLTGDRTPKYTVAYSQLFAARQIRTVGNPKVGNDPVRPVGAAASALMDKLSGAHHGVKVTDAERWIVRTWINEDATYGPNSGTQSWSGRLHPQDPVPPVDTSILQKRCDSCHLTERVRPKPLDANGRYCGQGSWPITDRAAWTGREESLINLDHPEKSLLLLAPLAKQAGGLGWCEDTDAKSKVRRGYKKGQPVVVFKSKDDPDYRQLLKSIQAGSAYWKKNIRRFDMPGYRPNPWLVILMKSWGVLPADYDVEKDGWDAEKVDALYFDHAIWPEDDR
jgi:hypothetical protein